MIDDGCVVVQDLGGLILAYACRTIETEKGIVIHRDVESGVLRDIAAALIRMGGVPAAMVGLSEAVDAAALKGRRKLREVRSQHGGRMDDMHRRVHHLNSLIDKLKYDDERQKREALRTHQRTRSVLVDLVEKSGACTNCVDVLFGHLTVLRCPAPACPGLPGDLAALYYDIAREVQALERALKVNIAKRWCMGRLSKSTREECEAVVEGRGWEPVKRWGSKWRVCSA